jgi:hypothetical protein
MQTWSLLGSQEEPEEQLATLIKRKAEAGRARKEDKERPKHRGFVGGMF